VSCARPKSTQRALVKWIGILALTPWIVGCGEPPKPSDPALTIELRWLKGFAQEDLSQVETGLLWTLSFLGATLPRETSDLLSWRGDTVTVRLDRAGIDSDALPHWERLLAVMKASEEYYRMGALDIGRFVARKSRFEVEHHSLVRTHNAIIVNGPNHHMLSRVPVGPGTRGGS